VEDLLSTRDKVRPKKFVHLSRRHVHAAVNPLERITIRGPQEKSAASESSSRDAAAV